jgi:hypothetical protein
MNEYTPSIDRLALRARKHGNLLAGPIALYKEQEGLDDRQLAVMLECDVESLSRLALCERPRESPHFREDVERIAGYIHADILQLALLIRAAEARYALRQQKSTTSPTLLAARDYEEYEE